MFWAHDCFGEIHFKILEMCDDKKYSFWQNPKEFFTTSDQDLRDRKKKNYESRRQMGFSSRQEN